MSVSAEGMRLQKAKWDYRLEPGLGFTAYVPVDPAAEERRQAALLLMEEEQAAGWEMVRAALPHRHERQPRRLEAQDRRDQERSLGRVPDVTMRDGTPIHLHPMEWDHYLLQLALLFPELAARLEAMRQEMQARREEYGSKVFNLELWANWSMGRDDPRRQVEHELANWVWWVAVGGETRVLNVLPMLGQRSRWVIANWICHPWRPLLPELED